MKTNIECRVCLKNGGKIPIFGDDNKPDISLEVSIFGSIELNKDDNFPKALCKSCFKLLGNAISFRKSALQADLVLQQRQRQKCLSASVTVKIEPNDENGANIPKPEFLSVNSTENDTKVKNEYISQDILLDDDRSYFDNEESNKSVIDYNKKEIKFTNYDEAESSLNDTSHPELAWPAMVDTSEPHVQEFTADGKKKRRRRIKIEKGPEVKNIECIICSKFYTSSGYIKHMRVVHYQREERSKKIECLLCKKMFRADYLPVHRKVIHRIGVKESKIQPKVSVECEVCKKMISQRYLKTHMKFHDEMSKKFICDVCGKGYPIHSSLLNHQVIHSNNLPFKCDYCPYRGRTKDLLRIHIRTHTGDTPYKCTMCSYSGITKSNLNRHMLTHKGPVDFLCDSCNKCFYTKLELERHITVTHFGIKNHICNMCGSAFGYRKDLMKHERQVHKRAKMLGRPKATYLKLQEEMLQQ